MNQKILAVLLGAVLLSESLTGCQNTASTNASSAVSSSETSNSEIENYTKYADYTPEKAQPKDVIPGKNSRVLVAYFSRSGNTSLPDGVDTVSSASLTLNADGTTDGNAERIAQWIADETDGDLFLIQTAYTYPIDYNQTVEVGEGQDRDDIHPALASHFDDISQYDTVYLVYPTWHYTLPAPVCSFLDACDFTGKSIFAFNSNAGSGFADTIEKIQQIQPNATVSEGVAVSEHETENEESTVREKVNELTSSDKDDSTAIESAGTAVNKRADVTVTIHGVSFSIELANNDTAAAFQNLLPATLSMQELHGNEKFVNLESSLPTDSSVVGSIQAGDLMLYGDNCVVLFYKSFTTSYSYTRIGRITDTDGLAAAVGSGTISASFLIN